MLFIVNSTAYKKASLVNIAHLLLSLNAARSRKNFLLVALWLLDSFSRSKDERNRSENRSVCLFVCLLIEISPKRRRQNISSSRCFAIIKALFLYLKSKSSRIWKRLFSFSAFHSQTSSKVSTIFHLCSLCSLLFSPSLRSGRLLFILCYAFMYCTRKFCTTNEKSINEYVMRRRRCRIQMKRSGEWLTK